MKNVSVIAHRGLSEQYPENTLLAFQKAVELGVDFIELDVRETIDGEIAVIHDETVDRTTDGKGYVKDLTYEEIRKLDAGKWKGRFEGVKVPALDEVLQVIAGRTKLLIEIKEACPEKIVKLLQKYNMESHVVIGSFNIEYIINTRKISPAVSTAFISGKLPENPDVLVKNGIPIVDVEYHQLRGGRIKEFLSRGISLAAWTVDDENDMKEFVNTDVSFITTNRPDILKKIFRNAF